MPKKLVSLLCLVLLLLPCTGYAQTYKVDRVVVEGNRRVERAYIEAILTAAAGRELTAEDIDRDIQAIFKTGRFTDVKALLQERDGRQWLVYQVEERPLLRQVNFAGNKELKNEKLGELVKAKSTDFYQPQFLRDGVQAIKKAYVEAGYHATEVETKVDIDDKQEATVTFTITEGSAVYVTDIRFEGNTVFKDRELKKALLTKKKWFLSFLTKRGAYREEMAQVDVDLLTDKYFNKGYIQARVRQPQVLLKDDKKSVELVFEIEEGPQFFIGVLDVQGDLLVGREELLAKVRMRPGDVFSRLALRENLLVLNDFYADQGYAFVNVTPQTEVDEEQRKVDITFEIEQGSRVRIGRIGIAGNTRTRDKIIRRHVQLGEGDLYSATGIKESRRRINNLGFFDEVNLTTSRGAEEHLMDVEIDVKERPTGSFSVGAGFSSADGLLLQGSVSQENFMGKALKLDLAASLGGKSSTYRIGLLDPYFLDRDLALGFDVYKTEREWTDFTREATGGNIKLGLPITDDLRSFFVYRYEKKDIYDIAEDASNQIKEEAGESTISSVTASLTLNTTDFRPDPSRGHISELSVEYAGLGGDAKFVKYIFDHRYFYPLPREFVFSVHGRFGYIQDLDDRRIPLDERFYLGGINSMRGFKTRELGPRDPDTGDYYGGNKTAFANVELTFPLIRDMKLKGVVFFDIGNAWDKEQSMFSDLRYSVGAGVRWNSPMGPLRFEWGYNLDPKPWEESSVFDFTVGRMF
jgi:outer membrane protein insertion porin family